MNVALYFGSFNPIHKGHLSIAKALVDREDIDELWFVVSPSNPLKDRSILADEHHRLKMVELAIIESSIGDRCKSCDVEFDMPRPSYTIDTLKLLEERYSGNKFAVVMGGDNIIEIEKWKDYKTLLENYKIFVYPRPSCSRVDIDGVEYLENLPLLDISSTQIREISTLDECEMMVSSTKQYILTNSLYVKTPIR